MRSSTARRVPARRTSAKFIVLLAAVFAPAALAAPFIVADVVAGVTQCGIYFDAAPKTTVAATNLTCRYDLSGIATGAHVVKMTAISANDPIWGTQESVQSAPLNFTKPSTPAAPAGLTLTP